MLLKLAALGTIGYAAYRAYSSRKGSTSSSTTGTELDLSDPQVALAGGPLSSEAALYHANGQGQRARSLS